MTFSSSATYDLQHGERGEFDRVIVTKRRFDDVENDQNDVECDGWWICVDGDMNSPKAREIARESCTERTRPRLQ